MAEKNEVQMTAQEYVFEVEKMLGKVYVNQRDDAVKQLGEALRCGGDCSCKKDKYALRFN